MTSMTVCVPLYLFVLPGKLSLCPYTSASGVPELGMFKRWEWELCLKVLKGKSFSKDNKCSECVKQSERESDGEQKGSVCASIEKVW
jgi:hypothetical protein